jgi:predicted DNA-binding transcriptional regulator AlpA
MEEVWGFSEIAEFLEISRPRATRLVNRHDFPQPIQTLASGRIWLADSVREWQRKRRARYPGPEESDEL